MFLSGYLTESIKNKKYTNEVIKHLPEERHHNLAINAVCPYFTMYPLDFPLAVLEKNALTDQWVLDPFCGRGTTNLAARLLGMGSVGIDSSQVAVAIAKAKLAVSSPRRVIRVAQRILSEWVDPNCIPEGPFWRWAFHESTLRAICKLRESLRQECRSQAGILLRAILLGALHGPLTKNTPSYLSNQSPRTFSPKPGYAVKYWQAREMRPPKIDVLSVIRKRTERYLKNQLPKTEGFIRCDDSRRIATLDIKKRFDWIVTSPPFFGMRTYIPDQWLRAWFLGGPDHVEYKQPETQLSH
ncbi:unnamed protein product, partial [marine sediment metagenome]